MEKNKNQPAKKLIAKKSIAINKKANFNYFLEDRVEAGIVLKGSEVKSLRTNGCNIEDSHADFDKTEMVLYNLNIAEYKEANKFSTHSPRRPRKLLLHKKESRKLIGKIKQKGYTIIATSIYFNSSNLVKVEIALAKGKKLYDKREDLKQKDWSKNQAQIMREK